MGWACGMHGGEEKLLHGFTGETLIKKLTWKAQECTTGDSKTCFRATGRKDWTGVIWLWFGIRDGFCEQGNELWGCIKWRGGVAWFCDILLASRVGLCSFQSLRYFLGWLSSQVVSQSVSQSVSQLVNQVVSQPGSQVVSKSISQSVSQSGSQSVSQVVSQSVSHSGSQSVR
jgi:hypothetical protein